MFLRVSVRNAAYGNNGRSCQMIWESGPWKQQLLRDAGKLRKLAQAKLNVDECERELVQFERLAFMTAYSMRKLWESRKLSTSWNAARLPCVRFPLKGETPDRLNWHHLDRHYDLSKGTRVSLKPEEYCDRMIHSFVFSPVIDDNKSISVLFHLRSNEKTCSLDGRDWRHLSTHSNDWQGLSKFRTLRQR
jgi:hypothetical protein